MATFTLDNLRDAVNKRYAPLVIENGADVYRLEHYLQLPKKKREALDKITEKIDNPKATEGEQLEEMQNLVLAATADDKGKELLDLLGENAAMLATVVESWVHGTDLGEAEDSSN